MAVHAGRLGIAIQCGLDAWARRPRLGRHLPELNDEELLPALEALQAGPMGPGGIVSSGATEIASELLKLVKFRNPRQAVQIRA